MQFKPSRRSYGSGSLITHRKAWYGQWWVGGRRVRRKVGAKRTPGTRDGLTLERLGLAGKSPSELLHFVEHGA